MNKAFKILWNDARRSYIVSDETTRSHGKPAKAMVAAVAVALAGFSGIASAAEVDIKQGFDQVVIGADDTSTVTSHINGNFSENYADASVTVDGGELTVNGGINSGKVVIGSGTVNVTGTDSPLAGFVPKANGTLGGYDTFQMTGGTVNLNNGRIWSGSAARESLGYKDMVLSGGTINMTNGGIQGTAIADEGNTVVLKGTTINVDAGANNVINGKHIEMSAGAINVDKGSTLQITTLARENADVAEMTEQTGGNFHMTGGALNVEGYLRLQHGVFDRGEINVKGGQIVQLGNSVKDNPFEEIPYSSEWSSITLNNAKVTVEGASAGIATGGLYINGGSIVLKGTQDSNGTASMPKSKNHIGGYDEVVMTGGSLDMTNGRLWIGSAGGKTYGYNDMILSGGTISMQDSQITGMAYADEEGGAYGNTIKFNGTNVTVKGTENVINSSAVELNAGSIVLEEGAKLQVSNLLSKDYTTVNGTFTINGGLLDASAGALDIQSTKTVITGGEVVVNDLVVSGQEPAAGVATLAVNDLMLRTGNARAGQVSTLGSDIVVTGGKVRVLGDLTVEDGGSLSLTTKDAQLEGNGGTFTVADGGTYNFYTASVGQSIATGFETISIAETATIGSNDAMIGGITVDANGKVTNVVVNDAAEALGLEGDAAQLLNAIYGAGANTAAGVDIALIVDAMQDVNETNVGLVSQTVREASAIANTAYVQTGTLDAMLLGNQAIYNNVDYTTKAWAEATAMSDEINDTEIDLGGVALGAQYAGGDWVVGLTANVGTGDTDNTKSVIGAESDFDYYGFALYGAKAFGNFNVTGTVGYTVGDHEVSVRTGKEDVDTDAINVGVRVDYKADLNGLIVKPYVGVDYVRLTTDSYGALADETEQDIVMFPVGVNVSKTFATSGGWTVAPALDLSWVPATGDTDAETDVFGVTSKTTVWGDNVVNARLGVRATNGSFSIGADVIGGTGDEDRSFFGGQVRADYRF